MLDAVVALPALAARHRRIQGHAVGDEDKVIERQPSDDEPFSALAFKIMSDPHLGKLTYVRRLLRHARRPAPQVLNSTKGRKERIGKIYQMHANKREEIASRRRRPDRRRHGPQGHHDR